MRYSLSQVHSLTLDVAMLLAALYTTEGSFTPRWKPNVHYIATDFHLDRFSSVLKNQLQSWLTDFDSYHPLRPLSETAEAWGVILQLRHTCVSHSAMTQEIEKKPRKTGKIRHTSWKTKMWWPKKSKISFHRICEGVIKASRWRF